MHPDQKAAGLCERCGDLCCPSCTRVVQGRFYCAGCVRKLKVNTGVPRHHRVALAFVGLFLLVLSALTIFYS